MYFSFEHFDIDDFDGYGFICIKYLVTCFIVFAFIDLTGVAFADSIGQAVGVLFYFFTGCVVHVSFPHVCAVSGCFWNGIINNFIMSFAVFYELVLGIILIMIVKKGIR